MSSEHTPPEPFVRVFAALELDSNSFHLPVDATFVPQRQGGVVDPSLNSLPILSFPEGDAVSELTMTGGLLGEGGRGQIRLAKQVSLRRMVAVKSLKGTQAPELTQELLREARITGGLEHPNIVPIYALGRDGNGRVLLVMRKVDGTPWGNLLRQEGPRRTDPQLERHLEVFRQVCQAVEFAHSQGIIHRDLKPDNVMVGAFGEVVVLDWGLAVSLDGDVDRELPSAASFKGLAGTPAYMAPELVKGDGTGLGRWTDIYLLGAVLHELITGAPPHVTGSLESSLEHAYHSAPPVYGNELPDELKLICTRAMAPKPADRFATVAEMRIAIQEFVRHRQSIALAADARRMLDALDLSAPLLAHATLAQVKFGFDHALKTWPENQVAWAGRNRALEATVELELQLGNLAGAELALSALKSPRGELVARVEACRAAQAASHAELEALRRAEHELNPEVTNSMRNAVLVLIAVVWCAIPVGAGLREHETGVLLTPLQGLKGESFFGLTVGAALWLGRRRMMANRLGRRFSTALMLAVVFSALTRLAGYWLDLPLSSTMVFEGILYACVAAMAAVFVDLRFVSAAVVYAVGSLLMTKYPYWQKFIMGISNLAALLPVALLWNYFGRTAREATSTER